MIRVLQASAWYPPAYVGGTEIYLTGLVRALRAHDISSRVIAPLCPQQTDGYTFDGATVRTYEVNALPSRGELRGDARDAGFPRFCEMLAEERPDVYHQHSWSRGLGGAHLHAAREFGLKTVVTVHLPNTICMRGTMMRFGEEACDGRIEPRLCGACWSQGRGAPKALAHMLGAMPPRIAERFERSSCVSNSRWATALGARALGKKRKEEFLRLIEDADRVVAVCQWLYDSLLLNGVPREKLVLSRQGVDSTFAMEAAQAISAQAARAASPFQLLYIGRWHKVKGIDVLVRAVREIPQDVPLRLTIHGIGDGPEERACAESIRRLAQGDGRIRIEGSIAHEKLPHVLAQADALAVPSLWLETGPMVVLEAKAAGLPVIGSRLGGIAELVREPHDGMLVSPGDIRAWTAAITMMIRGHKVKPAARAPAPIRTMHDVADDMAALYRSVCCASSR